jgi:hypothetical protein
MQHNDVTSPTGQDGNQGKTTFSLWCKDYPGSTSQCNKQPLAEAAVRVLSHLTQRTIWLNWCGLSKLYSRGTRLESRPRHGLSPWLFVVCVSSFREMSGRYRKLSSDSLFSYPIHNSLIISFDVDGNSHDHITRGKKTA